MVIRIKSRFGDYTDYAYDDPLSYEDGDKASIYGVGDYFEGYVTSVSDFIEKRMWDYTELKEYVERTYGVFRFINIDWSKYTRKLNDGSYFLQIYLEGCTVIAFIEAEFEENEFDLVKDLLSSFSENVIY